MTRIGKIDITPAVSPSRRQPIVRYAETWLSEWSHAPECPGADRDQIDEVLRNAIRSCAEGCTPWPLYVCGGPGRGKTFAGALAYRHFGGWFGTIDDWCETMNACRRGELYRSNGGFKVFEADLEREWKSFPLVVIDEIGVRDLTDAAHTRFMRMLSDREFKPLIALGNYTTGELLKNKAGYDAPIASRLDAGTVLRLTGQDRRTKR